MFNLETSIIQLTIEDAEQALSESNYKNAIDIYLNLITLQPSNPFLYCKLGQVYAKDVQWQQAIEAYKKAIDLDINNPFWVYKILGDALREEEKFDEAIGSYEKAISINNNNPEVYDSLGQVQSLKGDFAKATTSYEKALKLNISKPYWSYINLSKALEKEHRLEEANAIYQKALDLEKQESLVADREKTLDNNWFELHNQGDEYFKQEKWEDAISLYQQVLELNSNYFWSNYNLGRALSELNKNDEAIIYYERAVALEPNNQLNITIYQKIGSLFEELQQLDEAISSYHKVIELNASSSWAYRGLGNVFLKQNKLEKALDSYQKSIELKSDDYHTYEMLGFTLEQQENLTEAIVAYRNSLQLHPGKKDIQQKLASLEQRVTQVTSNEAQITKKDINITSAMDVVVTPNEVNRHHGTGILIIRMFEQSKNILSIRSFDHYNGEQNFGDIAIQCQCSGLSRAEVFHKVIQELSGLKINRIICIPYFPEDVLIALAIKEIFGVKLCTYIMDDQNVHANGISDQLMKELLEKSSLLLAISPEVRDAYEQKYNRKFWLLPGIVPKVLLQSSIQNSSQYSQFSQSKRGILVGNIWTQRWLDDLCKTLGETEFQVDWYANLNPSWLVFDSTKLEHDGLIQKGLIPESELVEVLRKYPYTILPTGSTNEVEDRPEIAKLSLPSRIPFILATSSTPVIVIGSNETAAASFVERFDVGVVCEYNAASFFKAVEYVCLPDNQRRMRLNAISIANILSAEGMDQWLWQSLETGEPCDFKFEKLLPRDRDSLIPFIEPPAPQDIWREFIPVYQSMRRLKEKGFTPDFVVDVGASTGIWSHTINKLFPQARFILLDPLMSRYDRANREYYIDPNPNFEVVEAAVSNVPGTTHFQVSPDFYGSSLLQPNDGRDYESVEVKIINLDWLKTHKQILGKGLVKIDVQCAEHLVLEGARNFLKQVEVIVIELSLIRFEEQAKTFREMANLLHTLGFRYYDDAGSWREPVHGTLLQKDLIFVRENIFVSEMHIGEF